MKSKTEQSIHEVEKKNQLLDEIKQEYAGEKKRMSEKIETLTEKLNSTTDEVMQKNLDYGRETALKEQTLSFKESKIADL